MSKMKDFLSTGYQAPTVDPLIRLYLDRTEPPIPYRDQSLNISLASSSQYPSARQFESEISNRFRIRPEQVIVTAGADESLDRACRAFLSPGDELLTFSPSFEMIVRFGGLAGASITTVPWLDEDVPASALLDKISDRTRLAVLVSPNNPTGRVISSEILTEIASQCAKRNPYIVVLIDLVYVEFADSDPTSDLLQFTNIILVRSFSKAWGLPGIRVGYSLGNEKLIASMRASGGPYSVASASLEMISENLEQFEIEMREYLETIRSQGKLLQQWFSTNGVRFIPSQSNFILLFPNDAARFDSILRSNGIRTRAFPDQPLLENARRLTMPGDREAFTLLQSTLNEALQAGSLT
jgi:histidinol-phosphate aminotransferase